MTDTNWKEMLAGLFLSKFSEQGYRRLGYASFKEAYEGLSNLVGGNPLSVRNYRDEFDPVFPNGRAGYFGRKMMPSRKEMLDATAIIVAHNHPSGSTTPSVQDRELTAALKRMGEVLGVAVLDHLIVTKDSYASIKEEEPT